MTVVYDKILMQLNCFITITDVHQRYLTGTDAKREGHKTPQDPKFLTHKTPYTSASKAMKF